MYLKSSARQRRRACVHKRTFEQESTRESKRESVGEMWYQWGGKEA